MTTPEQNNFKLTSRQLSLEFSDGTKPRLLFRLDGVRSQKEQVVCVIVDGSDSYDNAIQEINTLRKAISKWPSEWIVKFFQLSNTGILAEQKLSEFCKGEDSVERYFEAGANQIPSQYRGSFLRPCIETMVWDRSIEATSVDWIVIVLGDGKFTDFLPVTIPDWMKLVVISSDKSPDDNGGVEHLQWGTSGLVNFVNGYIPQFDGEVPLVIQGVPEGTRFFSVTDDGLQEWQIPGETTVVVTEPVTTFLIDCEPETALELSWWLRCKGQLIRLPATFSSDADDGSDLRDVINVGLRNLRQRPSFQILFDSTTGSDNHHAVRAFFKAAESASQLRHRWSHTEASSRFDELVQSVGRSQEARSLDAVLVIAARADSTSGPEHLIAIGLSKSVEFQVNAGDCIGTFSVMESFAMSFNRERRRWRLRIDSQPDLELGASSQQIDLPITYEALDVRVLFSRLEQR